MRHSGLLRTSLLMLLVGLAGCAPRSSQMVAAPPPGILDEYTAQTLVTLWQTQLCRYIAKQGGGDTGVLAELKSLRSRDVLRPARIRFGVIDVETGAGRWDVQGVLVARQKRGVFVRYVFLVGIVGHSAYLASEIRDLRLVALSPLAETLVWETSARDRKAVERYRNTFGLAAASRFPAADDDFRMTASRERVAVQELRSGADWSLKVRTDLRNTHGATVSIARSRTDEDLAERCRPH
ncbi:MAG: hypothetical protein P8Y76_15665 [bacterium]|jgi:hypothetical protein